ncbi:MAG: ABC transporter ATP-binding protein [Agarilytica sp.]
MIKSEQLNQRIPIHDGELHILKDINLNIRSGESVAIVGASGSGKSTLLGMLAGLDIPSSGLVYLNNTEITALDEEARAEVRSQSVGFVFQNFQLLPSLTALENVMLPLELKGESKPKEHAQEFLQRVGLSERLQHYPQQLSGGEQQRVALARAFACRAPIIFADEPTGNLDAQTGEKISSLLFELNRENGTTLVLVTHSTRLARQCQRRFVMDAGQLVEQSPS